MTKKSKEEVQQDIQGFMRTLLADNQIATLFLKSPQDVAKRFGIIVTANEAKRIKHALESVVSGKIPVATDCSWHDFPECHHVASGTKPQDHLIRPDLDKVSKIPTRSIIASDCSWHDFPECDHIASAIKPIRRVINPRIRKNK